MKTELELALERVRLLERLLRSYGCGPGEIQLCSSIRRALERIIQKEAV